MNVRIWKSIRKVRYYGVHITRDPQPFINSGVAAEPFEGTEKENSEEKGVVAVAKENLITKKTSKRPQRLINVLYRGKGLLPQNEELFWIHKRSKTTCSIPPPTKTCNVGPVGGEDGLLDPSIPQPKVIIIGAGLAGLSAAARLSHSGFSNYQIIEATDRLGGRIHSCWIGDVVAELGSMWLNRATLSNPLYSLAAQEDLLKQPIAWRKKPPINQTPFLSSDGRLIQPDVALPAVSLFESVRDQAMTLFAIGNGKDQGTLEEFMLRRLREESKNIPEEWRDDAYRVFWGMANEYKTRFGAGPEKLNSATFGSQISLPGSSLRIPLGLLGVVGPLLRKVNQKCINTCTTVESITWKGCDEHRAVVRLAGGKESIAADYVLVTVSLGILKKKMGDLFSPCLPEDRRAAIGRLGWGTVNRFILNYEKPFWLPGEAFYRFVWSKDELSKQGSWIKGLSVIEEIPGAPNMLTFSLGDEEAMLTENCSDDSITAEITKALRQFSGDPSLPYPKGLVRSKWGSDPNFLGSISYLGKCSSPEDYCELGKPLPADRPVILFAGEATHSGHPASLIGAHFSGIREAERILQLTARYAGAPPKPN